MSKITIDVEGEPQRIALAWAAGAGAAGAYWPSAFGAAAVRIPFFSPARRWLREVIREADSLVVDLRILELEVGASGPGPRYADSWTTDDDGEVHVEWETSVSLVLSSVGNDRLRLMMYGEHLHREDAVREWLARPDTRRAIKDWRELVDGPAKAMTEAMTDSERSFLESVSEERMETLAAYRRLVGR